MKAQDDPMIPQILHRLIAEFAPKRVFLFGSRAQGDAKPESDYDFVLVVSQSTSSRLDRMEQARLCLKGIGVAVDVFVYTEEEFDQWKNEFSSIPETAVNTGQELKVG